MTKKRLELKGLLPGFLRDKRGGVMIYTALALPVLLGFTGLSVDVGTWYFEKRMAQSAADAGALSGALEVVRTGDPAAIDAAAKANAGENGYNASQGDEIDVFSPPQTGPYAGSAGAVEVVVRRQADTFFSKLLHNNAVTVVGRAVAVGDFNDTCVWALNRTLDKAVKVSGGATVDLPCGVMSNSGSPEGMSTDGGGCLNATKLKVAGNYNGSCYTPNPFAGAMPVNDPFSLMEPPLVPPCDDSSNIRVTSSNSPMTLPPGTYCGKITVNSGGVLDFDEGLFILDGAGITVNSGGIVTGDDVTFYITANSGQSDNISFSSTSSVTLSAPSYGAGVEYPGVLFYQDRNSPPDISHNLTGQSSTSLEGIVYMPNQRLKVSGGSSVDPVSTVIVADTVEFTGNTETANLNGSPVQESPFMVTSTLVE